MDKNQAKELLEKFNEGKASGQELRLLEHWFSKQTELNDQDLPVDNSTELSTQMWQEVYLATVPAAKANKVKLWPRIAIAASVALVLGITGYLFFNQYRLKTDPPALTANVAPGKNAATLTLANGRKIKLSSAVKGKLAEEAGVVITKSDDGHLVYELKGTGTDPGQVNTLETAKGETYELRLPDGSLVWLNAESSISYTAALNDKGLRNVRLNGEAYFEVAHDAKKPFRVSSKGQVIEVLGTKFNVNAYGDEPGTTTTLVQGSVRVSKPVTRPTANDELMLKPGQQAILNGSQLVKSNVNPEEALAWKNGFFNFKNENLGSVMRKLSRWYNIEVEYKGDLTNVLVEGEIPRNTSLSQVLQVLEAANINFTMVGRKLIVSP
jgi:transmembrane sensor